MKSKFTPVTWSRALLVRLLWDDGYSDIPAAYVHITNSLYAKLLRAHDSFNRAKKDNPGITAIQVSAYNPIGVIEKDYEEMATGDFDDYTFVTPLPDSVTVAKDDYLSKLPYRIDFYNIVVDTFGFYWTGGPHHSSGHFTTSCIGWGDLNDQERLYL